MTELPWRSISTSLQELREFKIRSIGFLTINEGGTQQSLNQRPDFAQAKRECKRLHDEHLARTQEEYRIVSQPANSFVVNVGPNPLEDEKLEFSAFFMPWRLVFFFSELGQVSVAWRKTSSQPTGVWTVHSQIQHVQSCTAWSHFITRTRVAQELQSSGLHIFVSLKQLSSTCHVSFFAAPDTDHQHKFSLTHFIHFSYLSDGRTFAHKTYDSRPLYTPCDIPRQRGGSAQIPSRTDTGGRNSQNPKLKKKRMTKRIRTIRWQIFLTGWREQVATTSRQKWFRVSTVFIFTFRKTEIATSASEPKKGLFAEDALAKLYLEQKSLVTL